jgi:zinc D-Ala-D-Ala carboxypeptidase
MRLGRFAQLAVGVAALVGLIVALAPARAARTAPELAPIVAGPAEEPAPVDPLWTLEAEPIERVGYRNGRRHVIEVVPLGPSAVEVEVRTARAFLALRAAAAEAGIELGLASGFRTAAEQRALFRAWRKGRGHKAALPGRSNHQSGRALDIAGILAPGALPWLEANAAAFGFKRTVKNEPWHWEYVDIPIARGAPKRKPAKAAKAVARRPARHLPTSGSRVASSRR